MCARFKARAFLYKKDVLARHKFFGLEQTVFMVSIKRISYRLCIVLISALCVCGWLTGAAPSEGEELYLGGFPAGFVLDTTTVEVVGMCDVMTADGLVSPARDAGIKTGDIIKSINGRKVCSSEDVTNMLEAVKRADMVVERDGERMSFSVSPVKDMASGKLRVGVLVRDSLSGVGTVTYINGADNTFASLGHPVTDTTGNITQINGGELYDCVIYDVKQGVRGTPGELKGAFRNGKTIGAAELNCECGVYGKLSEGYNYGTMTRIEAGAVDEVTPGRAVIYTTVGPDRCEQYDISIIKVDRSNKDNRNFVIKIDDRELIEKTGGIVQGMSGSPIVQNGKLIGAVTHVFVNDPTRGFGISIENMLGAY